MTCAHQISEPETFGSSRNRQERGVTRALLQPVLGTGVVVDRGPRCRRQAEKKQENSFIGYVNQCLSGCHRAAFWCASKVSISLICPPALWFGIWVVSSLTLRIMLLWTFLCIILHASRSVMSNSLRPHGLWPARLLCPWGFSRQEYWSELPFPSPGVPSWPRDQTWVPCIEVLKEI